MIGHGALLLTGEKGLGEGTRVCTVEKLVSITRKDIARTA